MAERRGLRADLADPSIRLIIATTFVAMLGLGIVLPFLTLFARSFGVSYGKAGLMLSAFGVARLIFDLIAGPLIDRFGERLSASVGIVVAALSAFATALAPTFGFAVATRAVGGAGSAILIGALYSSLIKVVPRERMGRALAIFYGSFNIGIIAGGPVGSLLVGSFDLRATLYAYGTVMLLAAPIALRSLPEVAHGPVSDAVSGEQVVAERDVPAHRAGGGVADLLRQRAFVAAIVGNFVYIWSVAGVLETLVPLFARDELRVSENSVGLLFSLAVFTELLVLYPAGRWADRVGRKPVFIAAMGALAFATGALGYARSVLELGVLVGLLGVVFGIASVSPGAMVADLVPERSGTAVGIFRFAGDLGFVAAPLVAGLADTAWGFRGGFVVAAVPAGLCLLLVTRTKETLRRS